MHPAPPCELRENLLKKVGILKKAMDLLRIGELDQNYKSDFLPDKKEGKKAAPASAGSQLVSIGIAALWKSGKKETKNTAFCCVVLFRRNLAFVS